MIGHALTALAPQVDALLVNANRHLERYRELAAPYDAEVISDALADYQGPLAGIARGLAACSTDWLVCVPCDSPLIADDLVARLDAARRATDRPEQFLNVNTPEEHAELERKLGEMEP